MNRLKEVRQKLGVSKWKLAQETGLNWKTIHRIENANHTPFENSKEKIAHALGVSVEEIFPTREVKHIFIVSPKQVERDKRHVSEDTDVVGYLIDPNFRRCASVEVNLTRDGEKIASVVSEEDGRFIFQNVSPGEYVIVSRKIKQSIAF